MKHIVRLPLSFSDIITHDGVPELGKIRDYTQQWVEWMFTDSEMYAILSDARQVQTAQRRMLNGKMTSLYKLGVRHAAHTSEIRLENLIRAKNIPKQIPC